MDDKEVQDKILETSKKIDETLQLMDAEGMTESTFTCLLCGNAVQVRIIENGDAYASCETDDCFHTGLIHRRPRW